MTQTPWLEAEMAEAWTTLSREKLRKRHAHEQGTGTKGPVDGEWRTGTMAFAFGARGRSERHVGVALAVWLSVD